MFLELNGLDVTRATNDDVYELVVFVAAGHEAGEEIAAELQRILA